MRSTVPAAKVVLLTARMDGERLEAALDAGIDSAISKAAPPASVGLLIREVAAGNVFHAFAPRTVSNPVSSFLPNLTARELEILRWVAAGASNSAIARELFVTEQTVKFHLSNVYRKLGVANRTEASHYAHVHGLIDATQAQPMRTRCGPLRPRREAGTRDHGRPKSMKRISHQSPCWSAPPRPPGCWRAASAGRRARTRATPAVAASPAPSRAPAAGRP